MYRRFIAFLLICIFTLITYQRVVTVMKYYTKQDSFITTCINKLKHQIHCKGKCQLIKKLDQQEKKDQQNPERKSGQHEEVLAIHIFSSDQGRVRILEPDPVHPFSPTFQTSG